MLPAMRVKTWPRPARNARSRRCIPWLPVALALLVVGLLAGCSHAPAISVGVSTTPSPTSETSNTDAGAGRANAAVQQAVTSLTTATSRLAADFAWTKTAITTSGKSPSDLSKLALYSGQISAIGAGSAHAALQAARAAAKSSPPNCPVVAANKAEIATLASRAAGALAEVQALTSSALAVLQRATSDRAAVQAALGRLASVIQANPAATVDTAVPRQLAASYTLTQQQQLQAAVLRALASAHGAASSVQGTASAAAAVGTVCH